MGKDISLTGVFDPKNPRYGEAAEFRALYEAEADVRQVVDTAKGLEGLKRQPGVHAAGVILCREPLLDVIPVWRREQDGASSPSSTWAPASPSACSRWTSWACATSPSSTTACGTSSPTAARRSCSRTSPSTTGATYELLTRGDTLGVFQLDGGPMRALLRSMQPDNFEDISAVLALYRPGPMGANAHNDYADRKNGRKPVVPIHPELAEPLAEILGDTYGLIVYQEQVMAIAQKLAGYSPRRGRPAAPRDGQEEEGDPRQGVRPLQRRA